jgi:hypothetical protein
MAVYVDRAKRRFGRMFMCHMMADTTPELLQMADRIGLDRRWIQKPGTRHEHFDICLAKRSLAVKAGAIEVDCHTLIEILAGRVEKVVRFLNRGGDNDPTRGIDGDSAALNQAEHGL